MLPCEFVSNISHTAIDYKFIPAQPPAGHRLLSHTAVSVYLVYVWHCGAVQQCNNATQKIEGYGILRVYTYTFYKLDGKVLLIGVGYDKNTSLHLADVRAEYPGKHTSVEHSVVLENGRRVWKAYETLFVDGEDFTAIGAAFEAALPVKKAPVGQTELFLMRQRELVDFAVEWIEKNRTVV